ncbi:PQQ-binding-like beta-propeller repeat protein [Candidatus Woesearchaeota archaeon]|nr:PQQ-binding-like beta-propeller repeat protein [Candidatus Woesearchaeota archaeon]
MLEKLIRTTLAGIACLTINSCENTNSSPVNDTPLQYDSKSNKDSNPADSTINEFEVKEETYDQTLPCLKKTYCTDSDGDNYPVKPCEDFCEQPPGYIPKPEIWVEDCNDKDYDINLKAKEICNGIDDNCNGKIDEGFPLSVWYEDKDNDEFGDINDKGKSFCEPPKGYVQNNKDCDDFNNKIYLNALELCNGKDDNCNGQTDENLNQSCFIACNSGLEYCIDGIWQGCDAPLPQPEICDGMDNDCNKLIDDELTNSCSTICGSGLEYCIDGTWQNCDAPLPQPEVCDGTDNDCNKLIDDGLTQPCSTDCGEGLEYCTEGQWKNCTAPLPQPEVCDGVDNDCNGAVDDGLEYKIWFKDADGDGQGGQDISQPDCKQPPGFVDNSFDCDDNDKNVKSGSILWVSDAVECSDTYSRLALDNQNRIYVNDNNEKLYVLSSDEGSMVWNSNENALDPTIHKDGTVYVQSSDTKITAFDSNNPDFGKKWTYTFQNCDDGWDISGGIYDMSLSSDGTIYVSMAQVDWDFWADDYCRVIHAVIKEGKYDWVYPVSYNNDSVTRTSVGPGEVIYFGRDYSLYALFSNGEEKGIYGLKNQLGGYITRPPLFGKDNTVYLAFENSNPKTKIIGYNPENNSSSMSTSWDSKLVSPLVVGKEGEIYLILNPGGTVALKSDGITKWVNGDGNFSGLVLASNNTIYQFGESGLSALDTSNGKVIWELKIDEETNQAINPVNLGIGNNGNLYFCNLPDNKVYAVCSNTTLDKEALWPTLKHDNQRTGNFNNGK